MVRACRKVSLEVPAAWGKSQQVSTLLCAALQQAANQMDYLIQ